MTGVATTPVAVDRERLGIAIAAERQKAACGQHGQVGGAMFGIWPVESEWRNRNDDQAGIALPDRAETAAGCGKTAAVEADV